MFSKIAKYLRRFWGTGGQAGGCGLRSPREFERILELERQRADRASGIFSLITFNPAEEPQRQESCEHLARILSQRMRLTDHAGWIDWKRVGVVLPGTSTEGACMLAADARRQFPSDLSAPAYSVMTYPGSESRLDRTSHDGDARSAPVKSSPKSATSALPASSGAAAEAAQALFAVDTPVWKRSLDIAAAGTALLLLSPLLAVVAAAIKCTSPGPVLFSQWRSGLAGRRFQIYKFRSMVVDAEDRKRELMAVNEQDGPAFKLRNDPRITRLGRFLRSTSIDELPQLWNVLRGEMSLVGPRPLPCNETAGCEQWQRRRLDVLPGLTCIWQIRGRSKVSFDEWARMDIEYVSSRALWNDLKLIVKTVPAVLLRNGAH